MTGNMRLANSRHEIFKMCIGRNQQTEPRNEKKKSERI